MLLVRLLKNCQELIFGTLRLIANKISLNIHFEQASTTSLILVHVVQILDQTHELHTQYNYLQL